MFAESLAHFLKTLNTKLYESLAKANTAFKTILSPKKKHTDVLNTKHYEYLICRFMPFAFRVLL